MTLPQPVYEPPFNITRASHVTLHVTDLARSRLFYEQVVGLICTEADAEVAYLRGVEESCHHSVTLRAAAEPGVECVGMRVLTDRDLDRAKDYFEAAGHRTAWIDVPHQERTLRTTEPNGTPLEFCSRMTAVPRKILAFDEHRAGSGLRFDHYQIFAPDVDAALALFMGAGFRLSEYVRPEEGAEISHVFLQRKGSPHDIVFARNPANRLHHFAFMVSDMVRMVAACDRAGQLGFGSGVEYGPGRHFGPGHAQFTYLRDPDGHRVELCATHYQMIDIENEPVAWTHAQVVAKRWGRMPPPSWHEETSAFVRNPAAHPG